MSGLAAGTPRVALTNTICSQDQTRDLRFEKIRNSGDKIGKKELTGDTPLGKLCSGLRAKAEEIGFGELIVECRIEVYDALVRQIDFKVIDKTIKLR